MDNIIKELALDIQQANRCVVLTGAGVSTLSGLPDFRGPDGLYKKSEMTQMFDLEMFKRDPAVFYRNAADLLYSDRVIKPSVVHYDLAKMESIGLIDTVITQNIDLLHQKAGSVRVLELHGTPSKHTCTACGKTYPFHEAAEVGREGKVFYCTACSAPVKPDITFFGERLPLGVFEKAEEVVKQADLMLILGTSLTVYPAAQLPITALEQGVDIAIITNSQTDFDRFAKYKLGDLRAVFAELATLLTF